MTAAVKGRSRRPFFMSGLRAHRTTSPNYNALLEQERLNRLMIEQTEAFQQWAMIKNRQIESGEATWACTSITGIRLGLE